jgi:rhodanese-related sulfurtransferase
LWTATAVVAVRDTRDRAMAQAQGFRRINVAAARDIMSRGGCLVLDVRDADSYRRGHIDGSILATRENFSGYLSDTPKQKPVIICCYHGNSSQTYAKVFAEHGFSDVSSLDGGYEAWAAAERAAPKPAAGNLSDALQAFLAEHGFAPTDVNSKNKDQATPLMVAARLAPPALVQELLGAGADIHAVNADGNQALWLACVGEIAENIQLLIDAGIDIQHVNVNAATPLMFAASSGRAKAVAQLLAAGADPLFETDLGLTALDMASTVECLELMRVVVRSRKAAPA